MPVRFNPPPGWQVPPGFRPDAGWAPDPAWPPAPPGWEYWVDDAAPARPAPPAPPPPAALPPSVEPARRAETPAESTAVMEPVGQATTRLASPPPPAPPSSDRTGRSTAVASREPDARGAEPPGRAARRSATSRPGSLLIAGVAVACVALGCILGVMVSVVKTADAAQAVADAQRARDAAFELQTEVGEQQKAIDAMRAELEDREKALRDRESELTEKESQLTARQQELDDQVAEQEQQQVQQREQQEQDQAWFYWSCKDARKAGAAPIQQGQPGYRSGLDGNGNGWACEDGED